MHKFRGAMTLGALAVGLAAAPQAMAGGQPFPPTGKFSITAQGTEAGNITGFTLFEEMINTNSISRNRGEQGLRFGKQTQSQPARPR